MSVYPEDELSVDLTHESSDFQITNYITAYTVEQYIDALNGHSNFDKENAKTVEDAMTLARIIRIYVNRSFESKMCSGRVAEWCLWRINNVLSRRWNIE